MGGLSRPCHSKVQPVHGATQVTPATPACARELFASRRLATLAPARKAQPVLPNSNEAWVLPDPPLCRQLRIHHRQPRSALATNADRNSGSPGSLISSALSRRFTHHRCASEIFFPK